MGRIHGFCLLIIVLRHVGLGSGCEDKRRKIAILPTKLSSGQFGFAVRRLERDGYKIIQQLVSIGMVVVCEPLDGRKRNWKRNWEDMVRIESDETVYNSGSKASWALDRIDQPNLPLDRYHYDPSKCSNHLGKVVDIFVIDTGCRTSHNEFSSGQIRTFAAPGSAYKNGQDRNGHGTAVASLLIGKTTGVSKRANVTCIKAMGDDGKGLFSNVVSALEYAVSTSTRDGHGKFAILSMAARASSMYKTMDIAVQRATQVGLVVFAAAGNDASDACEFTPGRGRYAITVGATDPKDKLARFSNKGGCVDAVAPGKSVLAAHRASDTAYKNWDGTSFATPLVAGIVALRWDVNNSGRVNGMEMARQLLLESSVKRKMYVMPTLDGRCHAERMYSVICWETIVTSCACAVVLLCALVVVAVLAVGIVRKRGRHKKCAVDEVSSDASGTRAVELPCDVVGESSEECV